MGMCANIGIEDLAANALIEILDKEKDKSNRFVSYTTLEKYGLEVCKLLNEKGEKAILNLSRDETCKALNNYSDIFSEYKKDGILGIKLKDNTSIDNLITKFRGYLSLNTLLAFMADESKKILWE